jgi:hypothetical protein
MDDFLKELGMEYADHLPFTLGLVVGGVVLALWGAYKAHENGETGAAWFLVAVAIGIGVQYPAAYSDAKAYCRAQATTIPEPDFDLPGLPDAPPGTGSGTVIQTDGKCRTAFPNGV